MHYFQKTKKCRLKKGRTIFRAAFFVLPGKTHYEGFASLLHSSSLIPSVLIFNKNETEGIKIKDFKIKINKEVIPVSQEVYTTYYKMERRERYLNEVSLVKDLSYNQLLDKDYPIEAKMSKPQQLIEDEIVEKIMIEKMAIAIKSLTDNERAIINLLFFNGRSIREVAADLGISKSTLHEQKDKILKKLRKIINKL